MKVCAIVLVAAAFLVLPQVANAEDPTAQTFSLKDVTDAGGTSYTFMVLYSDDGPLDVDSIDDNDVRVTGPNGFDTAVTLVNTNSQGATNEQAFYSFVPPGGSWNSAGNGTYTIVMQAKQVFDSIGNPVHAGPIGTFSVSVTGAAPTPAQFLNISTRSNVQTGDNVMIGGFIITGSAAKKVLLRGIGPSLAQSGIANPLADPLLELHGAGGSLIASNNNWKDTQASEIQATTVPPSNDLESALVATLPANKSSYTAVVKSAGGGSGVGLVEVYDLDRSVDSKLANISTRGVVQTGTNVMIGGFILGNGSGAARIVARGIGPSLAPAGVSGALGDPTLELRDSNGELVNSNDNWKDTQQAEIQATGIAPTSDAESALVATLSPGSYTAIVAGKNGAMGVALVELFNLQ